MNDKLAAAIKYLRSRGKYVLDVKHDRKRWERMQDRAPVVPQSEKVRKIRA